LGFEIDARDLKIGKWPENPPPKPSVVLFASCAANRSLVRRL
jgi:hypothetical protein